jgi:hypothetical protein
MTEEKDEYGPQTVFKINHSDISGGISQCKFDEHEWMKLSDNEVKCTKCPTALIVSPGYLEELINK